MCSISTRAVYYLQCASRVKYKYTGAGQNYAIRDWFVGATSGPTWWTSAARGRRSHQTCRISCGEKVQGFGGTISTLGGCSTRLAVASTVTVYGYPYRKWAPGFPWPGRNRRWWCWACGRAAPRRLSSRSSAGTYCRKSSPSCSKVPPKSQQRNQEVKQEPTAPKNKATSGYRSSATTK